MKMQYKAIFLLLTSVMGLALLTGPTRAEDAVSTNGVPVAIEDGNAAPAATNAPTVGAPLPEAPVVEEAPDPVIPGTNGVPGQAAEPPEEEVAPTDPKEEAYDSMELMAEVIMHIRKHYVDEKSFQEIAYGALHGMLHSMDPHSGFLEPTAYEGLKDNTRGSFSGIGIHIGMRHGMLTVIAPIEDTPASRAGLIAGDRIIEIEGTSTAGASLRDAVSKLRGERGTEVTIKVMREGADDTLEVTMVRDDIAVSSVKGARLLTDRIGYIRITQFAAPTAGLLQEALETLLDEGMEALVLDLRSNPGGLLRSSVAVAQKFIAEDEVVVSTRGRGGAANEMIKRAGGALHYTDLDIAILVNRGSASASEIVAGCLQDHGRAVLIGETSFGKGSVQSVISLKSDEEAAIRLTTAYYYTPSGRLIHNKGIDPDIAVPVTPVEWRRILVRRAHEESPTLFTDEEMAAYADAVDLPLRRAIDMLQAVLIFDDKR